MRRRPQLRLVKSSPLGGADCCEQLGQAPANPGDQMYAGGSPGWATGGATGTPSAPVTIDPALIEREIVKLAERYDAERPAVSFSRWAADLGGGALIEDYKALLRSVGNTDVIAALDATPAAPDETPEQRIAQFDPSPHGGPWALNAAGHWFRVTTLAPGAEVIEVDGRQIYIPAEHPSVRVKENQYGAGDAHRKRWTDQKFRAANKALLGADPFRTLFFKVAPRGGWGGGQGFGKAFEGTGDDYDHEGGDLYPELEGGADAQALADWYSRNSFDARYGYDRGLTLNWLRVYTDAEGYRRYKAWSDSELRDFAERWHMASPGYVCGGDEVINIANLASAKQRERQGGQTEGEYSVHWPWIIGPLSQCSPTSSSRRRKNLKKAAAIAAVVVGAVFLGPMIAGALKGAAAKGAGLLAKIGAGAAKVMPKVIDGVNAAQTVQAMRNGEVPPPPISLTGERFVDYASAVGANLVEREIQDQGRQIADAERRMLEQEMAAQVRELQQRAITQFPVPVSQIPRYTLPAVSGDVRAAMDAAPTLTPVVILGGAALLVFLLNQR